jgi:hypothetical protein
MRWPARLLVWESRGAWSAAIRPLVRSGRVELMEIRSLEQCRAELARTPQATVAVEMGADSLHWLLGAVRLSLLYPRFCLVALGAPVDEGTEQAVQIEGLCASLSSISEAPRLIAIARRQGRRFPGSPRHLRERVWSQLPGA